MCTERSAVGLPTGVGLGLAGLGLGLGIECLDYNTEKKHHVPLNCSENTFKERYRIGKKHKS